MNLVTAFYFAWGVEKTPQTEFFLNQLVRAYSEPHRAYHTLSHLQDLLDRMDAKFMTPELVLAILYHDYVWYPGNTGLNEQRSARALIETYRRLKCPGVLIPEDEEVSDYINSPSCPEELRLAAQMILDTTYQDFRSKSYLGNLDLMGLASPGIALGTDLVREEFCFVSDDDFLRGQIQFLAKFLVTAKEGTMFWREDLSDPGINARAAFYIEQEILRLQEVQKTLFR